MSDEGFANAKAEMRAKLMRAMEAAPVEDKKSKKEKRSLPDSWASSQEKSSVSPDIESSEFYKILTDRALSPEEITEKLTALLTFDETDLDKNQAIIEQDRAILSHLLAIFVEHNRESIRLVKDNPLSHLRLGIKEVFENYHRLVSARSSIKDKLMLIDEITAAKGGAKGLVEAMLAAKDKSAELKQLQDGHKNIQNQIGAALSENSDLNRSVNALTMDVEEAKADAFRFLKPQKSRQLAQDESRLAEGKARIARNEKRIAELQPLEVQRKSELDAFMASDDWRLNERILEILDIGGPEFLDMLKKLSDLTLTYIDQTGETLGGVRDQLADLLKRVTNVHSLTHNTREKIQIMLEAHERAQKANSEKHDKFSKIENLEGLEALDHDKKVRSLNQHISASEKITQSTASVAGELGKVQSMLTNFKSQMEEGLADSFDQQLMATTSAAVTGNATLMRIEDLATFVQSLIATGQYKVENERALGELAKSMERAIMGRVAKNQNMRDVNEVLQEMAANIDVGNEFAMQAAQQRKEQVDSLIKAAERLGRVNEDALAIEAKINSTIQAE